MKLVRRARKSIRERRMKACLNDLTSNLTKVETRVFLMQKMGREKRRKQLGLAEPVPKDILEGKMNLELFEIECRLHEEAGLPKPPLYADYMNDRKQAKLASPRIGFIDLKALLKAVKSTRPVPR